MKKITTFFSAFLILLMLVFTGCSSNSNTAEDAKSTAQSSLSPTGTVKTASVRNTINPTVKVDGLNLDADTLYDEELFSVVIPKGAYFSREDAYKQVTLANRWSIESSNYSIGISILAYPNTTIDFSGYKNETTLKQKLAAMEKVSPEVKMDMGYKMLTVGGKEAVLLTGSMGNVNKISKGYFEHYFIQGGKGVVTISISKLQFDQSDTKPVMDEIVNDILSTLTIK